MTCKAGVFGHSPAMAGEGCDGCDAEHRRMMAKHVGDGPYVDPFERGAAVAFGLMGMGLALQARLCRCDEYFAWCVVHDTCLRCQHLLSETDDRSPAPKGTP